MNFKELSNYEIIEFLKESTISLELIKECILRNSENINHFLNKKAKENKEIITFFESLVDLPKRGEIIYYPNTDKIEFKNLPETIIVHIPEYKKRLYQKLDSDESFYLKLRLEKVSDSLNEYQLVENKNKIKDFLLNSYIGNTALLSLALTTAIVGVETISSKYESKFTQNITTIQDQSFISNYNLMIKELSLLGVDISILKNIEERDISLVLSLLEEKNKNKLFYKTKEEDIVFAIKEVIEPYIKEKLKLKKIAKAILEASKVRKVDSLLFLSIMKVETTTFSQNKVSDTGDISIAQIKPEVWSKEFDRLGKEPLDINRLKQDEIYAIDRMGEILEIQNKYKKTDPNWFARYHSKTPSRKSAYARKVQEEYLKIKSDQIDDVSLRIDAILKQLEELKNSKLYQLNKSIVNHERFENFYNELKKLKTIILNNKEAGLKRFIAKL